MKRQVISFVVLIATLFGCTSIQQSRREIKFPKPPNEMVFVENFNKVWDALLITTPDFPIINKNKKSGLVEIGWKKINERKRERLNILVRSEGSGSRILIESHVEVLVKGARVDTGFGTTASMPQWVSAPSDSMTSDAILVKIEDTLTNPPAPEKGEEKK